jgi:hypothetical protein
VWINRAGHAAEDRFCDPVQITRRRWQRSHLVRLQRRQADRNLRMGTFPAISEGRPAIQESREAFSPMVWVDKPGFKVGDWHHVALVWRNFDTGKNDASAALYIDGKVMGEIKKDYPISMDWDLDRTGIYIAVSYIGLMDELALFNRALTQEEISVLRSQPAVLSGLKLK